MLTTKTDNKTMPGFTCLNEECTALSPFGRMLNAGYDEIYGSDFCTCPICGAPAVKMLYVRSKRNADADNINNFLFNKSMLCTNMLCEFSYNSVLNPIFKTQRAVRCLKYPDMFDLPAYLQVLPVTESKTVEDFLMALKTAGYNKVRFGLRGKDAPKKFFMTKIQKYVQAEYNTDIYNLISALDYGILNIIAYFDKSDISSVETDSNTDEKQKYPESYVLNRILINDFNILPADISSGNPIYTKHSTDIQWHRNCRWICRHGNQRALKNIVFHNSDNDRDLFSIDDAMKKKNKLIVNRKDKKDNPFETEIDGSALPGTYHIAEIYHIREEKTVREEIPFVFLCLCGYEVKLK